MPTNYRNAGTQNPKAERKYSFEEVARRLLKDGLRLCQELLPGGHVRGREYVCASIEGGSQSASFSVNLHDGVWKDFATGVGGADLINLFATKYGVEQGEAKVLAEEWLGISTQVRGRPAAARQSHKLEAEGSSPSPATNYSHPKDDPNWWSGKDADSRWDYFTANKEPFGCIYKFVHPETGDKVIRPWSYATDLWEFPKGLRPLLYLPEIIQSRDVIVLVEGEKCADAAAALGYSATTNMGGAQAIGQTDWEPLAGRKAVLWRDNDEAGEDWEEKVLGTLREVGAASVHVVKVPKGKPPKWDVADCEPVEAKALLKDALKRKPLVTGRPLLRLDDWFADDIFEAGTSIEQEWLVAETFPMAVAVLFAAAGDTGKGMMILDLALKVAGKATALGPTAFGHTVASFGQVVILSAEDGRGEIHRRLDRIDKDGLMRKRADRTLRIVPFPNAGGPTALVRSTPGGVETTPEFDRIRDQLLAIDDLKLMVVDPLSAFIHADLDKDAAAAAFVAGQLANLATETGATVIVAHHMRKAGANQKTDSPEAAREAIRGSTGLINGVRCAYALWTATREESQAALKTSNRKTKGDAWRNQVIKGCVVKSNGPADREIHTYIRMENSGLLEDQTTYVERELAAQRGPLEASLIADIKRLAAEDKPIQHTSTTDGVYARRADLSEPLNTMTTKALQGMVRRLLDSHLIKKCSAIGSTSSSWLDVPEGRFARGEGRVASGAAQSSPGEEE